MAVADAFHQELSHVADEHIPVEASEDSGDEVEECLMKWLLQGKDGRRRSSTPAAVKGYPGRPSTCCYVS